MKCPKCDYLGFETGDRCKNCGYDFSLAIDSAASREPELVLREPEPFNRDADRWLNQLEARLDSVRPVAHSPSTAADSLGSITLNRSTAEPAAAAPTTAAPLPAALRRLGAPEPPATPATQPAAAPTPTIVSKAPALPLFHPGGPDSDEPLIKVAPAPRPPLAVRRTPDRPRFRSVAKPVRKVEDRDSDPVLAFAEETTVVSSARAQPASASKRSTMATAVEISGPARRLIAAAIDLLILLSIDAVVIYFTFQIAGVPISSWQAIPMLPLALFLAMLKISYFSVFTALGGQTVGKMATGIRVVADNDRDVELAQAVQRTLAALASVATVGIGFAPVLMGGERRALHDRVAGTRVIGPLHE